MTTTLESFKKTLGTVANDGGEYLIVHLCASFAKKTKNNSANYYDNNALYFLSDTGTLLLNASLNLKKLNEEHGVLIMNIYGYMIKKYKYSSDYNVIVKNMGSFCKKLVNIIPNSKKKQSIVELEEYICNLIDHIYKKRASK